MALGAAALLSSCGGTHEPRALGGAAVEDAPAAGVSRAGIGAGAPGAGVSRAAIGAAAPAAAGRPRAVTTARRAVRLGAVRSTTFKTAPSRRAAGGRAPVGGALVRSAARLPKRAPAAAPASAATFRRAQLAALRRLCATAPVDPRCDGTRVDERVAFAGLDRTGR